MKRRVRPAQTLGDAVFPLEDLFVAPTTRTTG
jgi:hypothetical protein